MKILFYGQGEYSNRGCEAIIKGTISILSKQINNLDVTVASFHAEQDKKHVINGITSYVNHGIVEDRWSKDWFWAVLCNRLLHNPELREKRLQKQVINTAHKVDAVFSIGGDNYCYGVPYFAYAIDKEIRKTNKTLFLWGASINDEAIDGKMVKDLERFDRIFVRESLTLESINKRALNAKAILFPDPAFTLNTNEVALPKVFKDRQVIGLNISPLIMNYELSANVTYKNVREFINYIIDKTDFGIVLIPHVFSKKSNDLQILQTLYRDYLDNNRIAIIDRQFSSEQLKYIISQCKMFVGARTHATIAAYSTCVPTLVVGYSVKARGIARDIFGSEENMVLPVQSLKHEDDLVNAFKYIQENEDTIRKHLQDFMPSYIEKAWQAGEEVKKLIEK
jgi:colanic acid/amylovoran biosynthesis protein